MLGGPRSSYHAQENFFQSELLSRGMSAVPCGLRFDSGAQFFEGSLSDKPSLMNDGDVAAESLHDFENV